MKKFWLATVLTVSSATAFAFADLHSAVKLETKAQGDNLAFTFKTEPNAGLEINPEGPWKLEIKKADGLTLVKTTLVRADFDDKAGTFSFVTTAKPTKSEGEIEYKYIAFVCTKEKTQCFRDVHEGKASWKSAAK